MRRLLAAMCLTAAVACGPRAVEVSTGAQPASEVALRFSNNLSQSVNVYISSGGSNVFLKQVAANSVEWIPVQGFRSGTMVNLMARAVSGSPTYTRNNVVLEPTFEWRVP